MDLNIQSDKGPVYFGGFEELLTDFDCWITKWNIRFQKRSPANQNEIPVTLNYDKENRKTAINKLQDLLVYGFANKTLLATAKDAKRLDLERLYEDLNSIDYVIIKLVKENERRRVVIINKSKL